MTLEEKVGQMTQAEQDAALREEGDVQNLALGSLLSGGSSDPKAGNSLGAWTDLYDRVQSLALKSAQPRYEAFLARAPSLIAARARERRGAALAEALRLWERAQALAGSATHLSLDPQSVVFEIAGLLARLAPKNG